VKKVKKKFRRNSTKNQLWQETIFSLIESGFVHPMKSSTVFLAMEDTLNQGYNARKFISA